MGLFDQLVKTVARAVTLPVSVAKDVVTMGGVLDDSGEIATLDHLKKLVEDIEELPDSVDGGG